MNKETVRDIENRARAALRQVEWRPVTVRCIGNPSGGERCVVATVAKTCLGAVLEPMQSRRTDRLNTRAARIRAEPISPEVAALSIESAEFATHLAARSERLQQAPISLDDARRTALSRFDFECDHGRGFVNLTALENAYLRAITPPRVSQVVLLTR